MSDAERAHGATEDLWKRAQKLFGGEQRSVSHGSMRHEHGLYPHFAVQAEGCRVQDTEGRDYIDWSMGCGPLVLGHRHPEVERAIREQLARGTLLSLMHPLEVEVAERFVDIFPFAERVAFGKNGSDVVTAAVRIARAATRRDVILSCGYHGFHDWYVPVHEQVLGLPSGMRGTIHAFSLGDLEAFDTLMELHEGSIAGVVIDTCAEGVPEPGFLEHLRDRTRASGSLLIFDEVLTGFRVAWRGSYDAFGVTPDLACFGKAFSGGMPLSALVGPAEYMRGVPHVGFVLTYRGETLALAAAKAALDVIEREDVPTHLGRIGAAVRRGFDEAARRAGVPATLLGHPSRSKFRFEPIASMDVSQVQSTFLNTCLEHGVLSGGGILPSLAHDERAVEQTLNAFEHAFAAVNARAGSS